jgi:hypothetical protein
MTELTIRAPAASAARPSAPAAASPRRGLRPASAIAGGWALVLVLSLYGAQDVSLAIRTSAWLGESRPALALAAALDWVGQASRLSALHRILEGDGGPAAPDPTPPVATSPPPPAPAVPASAPAPAPAREVHRVLLVGASSIQFHLGVELERELASAYAGLQVLRLGKLSTGLTRPDVFDWPAKLRELVASFRPDLVIANFGGNDGQSLVLDGGRVARFGQPEWERTYRARLQQIVAIAREGGAQVALLGMSTTRDPVLSRRMARINTLMDEVAAPAGAHYLSIWDLGADRRGQYQEVATIKGVATKTRLADGKHFSRAGAAFVAVEIGRRLATLFALRPAAGDVARAK